MPYNYSQYKIDPNINPETGGRNIYKDGQLQSYETMLPLFESKTDPFNVENIPADSTAGIQAANNITFNQSEYEKERATAQKELLATYQYGPADYGIIHAEKLKQSQAQIDAINQIYADQLTRARQQGLARVESRQFAQGRAGQIGSGTGEAGVRSVEEANVDVEKAIQNQQTAALNAIYAGVADSSAEELKLRREASTKTAEARVAEIMGRPERNKNTLQPYINDMIRNNLDPRNIDLTSFTKSLEMGGLGATPEEIYSQYDTTKKAQKEAELKAKQEAEKAAADLAKTKADTEKILSDVENWGKLTEHQKETLAEAKINNANDYKMAQATLAETIRAHKVAEAETARAHKADEIQKQSELAQKALEAAQKAGLNPDGTPTTPSNIVGGNIDRALQAVTDATTFAGASGQVNPVTRGWRWLTGSEAQTDLIAQANTLRTLVMTLRTDPATKKFFGPAMSNADVQFMMSGGTTLNPELQSPEMFKKELESVKTALEVMKTSGGQAGGGQPTQVMYQGVMYNVDANGDMTPAE